MQERLNQIIEKKGLTATKFAAMIGVNASTISHILAGRNKPGFDIISNIAKAYPDISLNWLITGNGSMDDSTVEKEKKTPVQEPTLFNLDENSEKQVTPVIPEKSSIISEEDDQVKMIKTLPKTSKKIKRIILFFEDGSFEDYEKE
ncbi:helix-turn-helix domain-containing protein [Odoribacter sp. AF15-53]|uniref:helix-turn-helix domain-containing protein n=1 Tax=Odoribacter sp. AF15-53 TaxID=2292236 RepID=UPI000E4909D3|nr:helix-turn-helix transcriptional regulator [Odoribacter sp. AF15-53]RHR83001.1 helix-turn-helix domain-containing protein [Odoribacter sp. AF15-53]